ncbi:DNA translocase FtsK 4TM domain-containing protein [Aliiroseovarius sp. PTFE2010]|uniref:DNA translocase FtsK 4TM domain-containing protein n=1 Tax=Aliiroseovarius sp. PTFE2010 TaxID=3417190 RepID=UPI003CEC4DC7
MASFPARQRDPLFDRNTQAILEARTKELFGLGLLGVAIILGMIIGSYDAADPSWLAATDEPARNLLGRFGASVASPLFVIAGYAAWGIVLICAVWALRFMTHHGAERALPRVLFGPIAVAIAAVYAATLVPGAGWTHSFGLGGMFGETALGAFLNLLGVTSVFTFKLISALLAAATVAMFAFVLGFTRSEIVRGLRYVLAGIVMTYAAIRHVLRRGAAMSLRALSAGISQGARAISSYRSMRAERRDAQAQVVQDPALSDAQAARVMRPEPLVEPTDPAADTLVEQPELQKPGLLARVPSLLRRNPEPAAEPESAPELDGDDRIKAKIAHVIKSRSNAHAPGVVRDEPPLTTAVRKHRKGPDPMILNHGQTMPEDVAPVTDTATAFVPQDLESVSPSPAPETDAVLEPEVQTPVQVPIQRTAPKPVVQHAPRKATQPSRKAIAEAQPALNFDGSATQYDTPPLSLLTNPDQVERHHLSDEALEENARMLESVLDDYGVKGEIVSVRPGPVVTMYELEPAPGLKASRVIGLADDIARSMSALSTRVSTVPGRSVIGIELPNVNREKVVLREILAARDFGDGNQKLPLALGKDIGGDPIVANLAKMPHLLIAGTTGSGKSVAINTMILSLLYKLTPEDCRLIMIDPKMLELSVYDGIPHLLSPVVTDPKKAVVALKWVVAEMEERYRKMSKMGVRNIDGYNSRVADALSKGEMFSRTVQTGFDEDTGDPIFETEEFQPEKLPYIVVVVDEMADLMMVAGKEIEACIQRLAQMARASGIHLIMATQRPSVDVITGTIKANFPTRISFQVTSKVDSRTILGEQGAEQLLGMGDMLYMAGGSKIIRVHGPFVSDEEVEEVVNCLKAYGPPEYVGGVVEGPDSGKEADIDAVLGLNTGGNTDMEDALYDTAVQIVVKDRKCSTSYIQRKLAIGYNKAARLVEQMEDNGVVSAANHVGKREILVPEQ